MKQKTGMVLPSRVAALQDGVALTDWVLADNKDRRKIIDRAITSRFSLQQAN